MPCCRELFTGGVVFVCYESVRSAEMSDEELTLTARRSNALQVLLQQFFIIFN